MKNFFSVDSPLFRFFERLWDIIKLNFFWLICSLPIVTIGPATAAAFSITLHMVDDTEGYIVKPFFKAFKANLKNGIPLGILWVLASRALYLYCGLLFDIQDGILTFNSSNEHETIMLIIGLVFFVLYVDIFLYSFPLMARYENSLVKTVYNSYRIALKFNIRTVLLVGIIIVEVCLFIWDNTLMIVGLLIAPGCIMLTISGFALSFFKKLEQEPGAVQDPKAVSNPETVSSPEMVENSETFEDSVSAEDISNAESTEGIEVKESNEN